MKKIACFIFAFSVMLSLSVAGSAAAIKTVDSVTYRVNSDGMLGEKYAGWAAKKSSGDKYYYQDGAKQTGWLAYKGNKYYLNRDGIMRTGWVAQWDQVPKVYYFDQNGVWDGQAAKPPSYYQPETVGDFLLDHDFLVTGKYGANIGNGTFKEFVGIQTALTILTEHSDVKLLYDNRISDDEIEINNAVYRGKNDIFVRLLDEKGKLAAPGLHFSKDKAGNSYFYCNYYNFGVKLKEKDAYDKIAKLIKS